MTCSYLESEIAYEGDILCNIILHLIILMITPSDSSIHHAAIVQRVVYLDSKLAHHDDESMYDLASSYYVEKS